MGTIKLYQKDNIEMQRALIEFVENSEACAVAHVVSAHVGQIFFAYVFVEDGVVAGLSGLFKNKYVSCEELLVVREGFQGRGIATKLQTRLLAHAHNVGLSVTLTTFDTEEYKHVIRLYKKFNFVQLGKFKQRLLFGLNTNNKMFNFRRILIFYYLSFCKELLLSIKSSKK